jgi:hypothetical protein
MNSLFNYELDEQKIRSTLHNAELDYSDSAWFDFDNEFPAEASKPNPLAKFDLPKINLNINRNVLIPIFFILALGGVSAIMFKFIDFKTNKPQEAERALESESASLNIQQKTVPPPVKKEEPKQMAAAPVEIKKDTIIPTSTPTVAISAPANNPVVNNTYVPQKSEAIKPQYDASRFQNTEPAVTQKTEPAIADTSSNSEQKSNITADNTNAAPAHQIIYKNRRKKLVIDQVETIKAPSLMSAQTPPTEEEPELKIKPDKD